jgi:hypothetical protein
MSLNLEAVLIIHTFHETCFLFIYLFKNRALTVSPMNTAQKILKTAQDNL